MKYNYLDMETYKRKKHFEYFNSLAYPYVGLTVNVDITEFLKKIKAESLPFFLSFCYCAAHAANRVPPFRQRILDGRIIELEHCLTSHTLALEDGTYCYCTLDSSLPFRDYLPYAVSAQEEAKRQASIAEEKTEVLDKFFLSTLPWVSYTALIQPVPMPADSNPRITWGKYFTQEKRLLLPVSVLCHHALVDGIHISEFYRYLSEELETIAADKDSLC